MLVVLLRGRSRLPELHLGLNSLAKARYKIKIEKLTVLSREVRSFGVLLEGVGLTTALLMTGQEVAVLLDTSIGKIGSWRTSFS